MTGYDGNGYDIGDRVELHPGCDLWMRGAKFGTVTRRQTIAGRPWRVSVRLDTGRITHGAADRFRRVA